MVHSEPKKSEKGTIVITKGFEKTVFKNITEYAIANLQEFMRSPKFTFKGSRQMVAAIRLGKLSRDPALQKVLEKKINSAISCIARKEAYEARTQMGEVAELLRNNGEIELAAAFDDEKKRIHIY